MSGLRINTQAAIRLEMGFLLLDVAIQLLLAFAFLSILVYCSLCFRVTGLLLFASVHVLLFSHPHISVSPLSSLLLFCNLPVHSLSRPPCLFFNGRSRKWQEQGAQAE